MTRQGKLMKLLMVVMLMVPLVSGAGGWSPSVQAQTEDVPTPMPRDCDDVAPASGPPPDCCLYGYIYHHGLALEGASVHIESPNASLDLNTAHGPASDFAYYGANLSDDLLVSAGDTITVTASHDGMVSSRTWTVQGDGQQVDLGLLSGYQAPGPSAGPATDVWDAATADTGLELTVLTPERAGLDSPDGAPAVRSLPGADVSEGAIRSPMPMGPASVLTVCQGGGCDYATIQDAVDAAADGDLIKVAEGTYTDMQVRPRNDVTTWSPSTATPITLSSAPRQAATTTSLRWTWPGPQPITPGRCGIPSAAILGLTFRPAIPTNPSTSPRLWQDGRSTMWPIPATVGASPSPLDCRSN